MHWVRRESPSKSLPASAPPPPPGRAPQQIGCALLRLLATIEKGRQLVVQGGGREAAVAAMRQHPDGRGRLDRDAVDQPHCGGG